MTDPVYPQQLPALGSGLLTPGQNYLFRLNDGYEFEATCLGVEPANTSQGSPGTIILARGIDRGWVNVNSISLVWDRPEAP